MQNLKRAIVKAPTSNIKNIWSKNPYLNKPDYDLALREHKRYINALKDSGVEEIIELPSQESLPLSMCVEDVAIVIPNLCVIFTNVPDKTRFNEDLPIREELSKHFKEEQIFNITGRAYIRGGDVLMVGNTFFVGASAYTNQKGIKEFAKILSQFNKKVVQVNIYEIPYLKAGISYIENNTILIAEQLSRKKEFQGFKRIVVPDEEFYAINSLWINGKVIVPLGSPRTSAALRKLGYDIIETNLSEYCKIDVGASLLSIRF